MEIKQYPKNAKKYPEKQLKALADIVAEVGWRQPVLVNQNGVIVAGHGRWMAWEKYKDKLKEIWVIDDKGNTIMGQAETTPLTPEQEKAYRLADNKLNESDWDMELAIDELREIPDLVELTGFSEDEIKMFSGLNDAEKSVVELDRMDVLEIVPPEAVYLKERCVLQVDDIDDYDVIKNAIREKKLTIEMILSLFR